MAILYTLFAAMKQVGARGRPPGRRRHFAKKTAGRRAALPADNSVVRLSYPALEVASI